MKFGKALLVLVAMVAVAVVPMSATGKAPHETEVTIKGPEGDFSGKLKSDKSNCETNRKVKVYKKKRGDDKKIGDDIAEDGKWSTGNSGYKKGRFYAKVGNDGNCLKDKSPTITIDVQE